MTGSIHLSLSGLSAFQRKSEVIANNVANSDTDNFKKSRTVFSESPGGGGVTVQITQDQTPGIPKEIVQENETIETVAVERSNVDLAEELTELIPASVGYRANLATIKTDQENLGTLLDIFE